MKPLFAPDIEELITSGLPDILKPFCGDILVSAGVPSPRPGRFITVAQFPGGGRSEKILDTAVIGFECWAERDSEAKNLALATQAIMLSLAGEKLAGVFIYNVGERGAVASLPDPDSKQARYVWTAIITVKAV